MTTEDRVSLLQVKNVHLRFGGIIALDGVSLDVREGEILGIIGPNGSGKTCLLNCINGFYRPQQGEVWFEDRNITRMASHNIARLGIARVFQNVELYTGLSTLENLMAARYCLMKQNPIEQAFYFGRAHGEEIRHRRVVEYIIDFLEIESIRKEAVGLLPYGMRKRVELGRALALEPRILLLDEPMAGMNLEEKEDISRFILDIAEVRKIPIVLVEHDMGVVTDLVDRITVIDMGHVIAEGTPKEVMVNPVVIEAYLGKKEITSVG